MVHGGAGSVRARGVDAQATSNALALVAWGGGVCMCVCACVCVGAYIRRVRCLLLGLAPGVLCRLHLGPGPVVAHLGHLVQVLHDLDGHAQQRVVQGDAVGVHLHRGIQCTAEVIFRSVCVCTLFDSVCVCMDLVFSSVSVTT